MTEYVRDEDLQEYRKFGLHHLGTFSRALPTEIWHYTNADGLIGILQSGKIFATQVSCLNDSREQRYFGDLVLVGIKQRMASNTDPTIAILLKVAHDALLNRDFSAAGYFVTCFSEVGDDLGQWRGYGGGECGYAIGFQPEDILKAVQRRPGSGVLLPMNYNATTQKFFVEEVMDWAEKYFLAGKSRGLPDMELWAKEFLTAYAIELDLFASIIKHPSFAGEIERRVMTLLRKDELLQLEFRQKRTLLARHLPLDLSTTIDGKRKLPITRVFVGPGHSQQVSKISVGDLLSQCGYDGVPVELSSVPYRVP
jgi:hypothetical protein